MRFPRSVYLLRLWVGKDTHRRAAGVKCAGHLEGCAGSTLGSSGLPDLGLSKSPLSIFLLETPHEGGFLTRWLSRKSSMDSEDFIIPWYRYWIPGTNVGGVINMRVLIVEDDQSLGGFLRQGLELEGHKVEWAEDGEAALARVTADHPDLVLLDL